MQHIDEMQLKVFKKLCEDNKYFNVSYPADSDFDFSAIKDFLDYSLNNCGDHETYCNYVLNTFDFENEVITYFAELFKGNKNEIYGYVTNGGTEGNMWGLFIARKIFPDGIVYFSKDAHYSVKKSVDVMNMKHEEVSIQDKGEMDYEDLIKQVKKNREENKKAPIIIFATIGSTTRGAVDNVKTIRDSLRGIGIQDDEIYIHADEALSGSILPFIENPQPHSFKDGIDSLAVSGHKGFGSPIPCGIALAKRKHIDKIKSDKKAIEYIKSHDLTISGSRNGFTPLIMWYGVKSQNQEKLKERVRYKLNLAEHVVEEFRKYGIDAWRHENSITIVAPRPSEPCIYKHKLAPFENFIHIITTAHNSKTTLDWLIQDLRLDYDVSEHLRNGKSNHKSD